MASPFDIDSVYSFDVYPVALLGNNFKNVTVLAIMNQATAQAQGFDTYAAHANVFPTLPTGTVPNDPSKYSYIKIKTPTGDTAYLGIPWVVAASIALVESRTITVQIAGVSASDQAGIKAALNQNGYSQLTFSIN